MITESQKAIYSKFVEGRYPTAIQFFSKYVTEASWSAEKMAKHSMVVSGSKIGAICGHCKWRTPLDIYLDMQLQKAPFAGNAKTRRGQALEHEIAFEAAEILHGKLGGGMELTHPEFNGFTCQIDETLKSSVLGVILVECKWISFPTDEWGKGSNIDAGGNIIEEDSKIPQDYADQVMWQLGIANAVYKDKAPSMAILSAVIKNAETPRIYVIRYSKEAFAKLIEKATEFLFENIIANCPPKLSEQDVKAMEQTQKKQKTVAGDYVNLTGKDTEQELFEAANKYKELANQINELKAQQEEYKQKIISAIGDHEGLLVYDTLVATYKSTKDKVKFNEKLFAEKNPALYQEFSEVVTGSRIFSNKL